MHFNRQLRHCTSCNVWRCYRIRRICAQHAVPRDAIFSEGVEQLDERQSWAASVRSRTGRQKHRVWEPEVLNPPPLLADISVVLVNTKRPGSIGSVARSASCFECEDIRIVQPRCDPLARSARNSSKGAQYLLWRANSFETLQAATQEATVTIAFTRWIQGRPNAFCSPAELLSSKSLSSLFQNQDSGKHVAKVMFVFGREDTGLTDEEVASCSHVCSIPIGRLQESLSLSHAVSIVLSQLYSSRLHSQNRASSGPLKNYTKAILG